MARVVPFPGPGRQAPAGKAAGAGSLGGELLSCLDSLYSAALQMVREPSLAEDLVQETCLKACRAWSSLRSRSSFRAWIFTILYNTVRNHRRGERGAFFSDVPLEELALDDARPGAVVSGAPAGALHPEAGQDLRRALEALPVQFREAVCLVDVEGFTLAEASRILNVPPGTVASRLYRAHQRLRRHLSGDSDARGSGGRQGSREERP